MVAAGLPLVGINHYSFGGFGCDFDWRDTSRGGSFYVYFRGLQGENSEDKPRALVVSLTLSWRGGGLTPCLGGVPYLVLAGGGGSCLVGVPYLVLAGGGGARALLVSLTLSWLGGGLVPCWCPLPCPDCFPLPPQVCC